MEGDGQGCGCILVTVIDSYLEREMAVVVVVTFYLIIQCVYVEKQSRKYMWQIADLN